MFSMASVHTTNVILKHQINLERKTVIIKLFPDICHMLLVENNTKTIHRLSRGNSNYRVTVHFICGL